MQLASWPLRVIRFIFTTRPSEVSVPFLCTTVTGFAHCLDRTEETEPNQFLDVSFLGVFLCTEMLKFHRSLSIYGVVPS